MTREEAIERLNIHKSTSVFVDSIAEAIDMAIEALHREEAEEKGYCHRIRPSNVEVVVRCKDCRWQKISRKSGLANCGHEHGMMRADDNNFCSYAERREPSK